MSFLETVELARAFLERNGRVSLRGLKLEFGLDDDALDELVEELVDVQQVAAREGNVLSWIGAAPADAPADEREAPAAARQPAEAERRQLTVMFCDLVGSTELSERLDAEALSEVVAAYQKTCAARVESFDGHIAQYLGDGVLVYFGYPLAHEDDAMRAIHAALRIAGEVPGLNSRLVEEHAALREHPLQIRVGIHTGPVVVGELGGGEKRERLALGGTVNIAARLEGEAEPGSIVVSNATRHLVQGAFVFEELGERSLKGIEGPVALSRPVQATGGVRSRLALAGASGLTPLVGREQQVGLVLERWEEAKAGHGQVVLLSGEAGMGKSRLIEVLREHAADEPHTWNELRGSAYHQNSAFHPVIELIEQAVMFTETDSPEERVAKLARALGYSGFPTEEILLLVADFLGLPPPENLPPLALNPEARRRRILETFAVWPVALAQRQPMIMIAEDLHWYDTSSLEAVGMVIEQVPAAPILFIATFRPEFEPPWPSRVRLMHLPLQPLTPKQSEAMARHLTGGKQLPLKVREEIAAKADGVPLFVEELTKSILESDLVVESDERFERSDPLPDFAIPSTLRDSLTARLDRLGPAKEVAQLASVLGREFSHDVLRIVSPLEPAALDQALGELVGADLLYQRGIPPLATYIFKHALIQDAAYQSLLKKTRREHHAMIAQVLEELFPQDVESAPEMIARHYDEAGLAEHAIVHYQRAGERSVERSANQESIVQLRRALELLATLPEAPERNERELRLQMAVGMALSATRGWGDAECEAAFERARSLASHLGDGPELPRALVALATSYYSKGEIARSAEVAKQALTLAERAGAIYLLSAHYVVGSVALYQGEFPQALHHLEQTIELYDPAEHASLAHTFGNDRGVASRIYAAWCHWFLGRPDRALATTQDAVALARRVEHPVSLALALALAAVFHFFRGDRDMTREYAEETIALCERLAFPLYLGVGRAFRGWAQTDAGERGVAEIQQALAELARTGTGVGAPVFLAMLAEANWRVGRYDHALGALGLGVARAEETGQYFWDAELHRLRAQVLLDKGDGAEEQAEALFRRSLEIARGQEAKSLELRTAMSYARLLEKREQRDEARNLLAPIYYGFTEGQGTQDLKDAKALLAELA